MNHIFLPTQRIDWLSQKGKVEKIKPLTDDEVHALFKEPLKQEFVSFRDYTIMLVILDTGVRLSELINMKVTDVSINDGKILVLGKGNKERDVMFPVTTKEQLRRYIKIMNKCEIRGRFSSFTFQIK
ncbi:MAG: tyrosine-type recombinase/integrase [Bacillota bacterium]|nr:tyrosine-type recombinase/integrase [Bacillota bacterium]